MNGVTPTIDVVIIGAGPAGVLAAARAAELGARTILLDRKNIGGMAVNDGPVPVRTLAHAARLMRDARQLVQYGIVSGEPTLDYSRLLGKVSTISREIRDRSTLRPYFESLGGSVREGTGAVRFEDPHTVMTESGLRLRAGKFIICTGGVSRKLPIAGFEHTSTHSDAWALTEVPSSMIVVGGGATGLQVASIFNTFGTRVELFEAGPRVLPGEDADTATAVSAAFRDAGVIVREDFGSIDSFAKTPDGVRMTFTHNRKQKTVEGALAVIAVGWSADTDMLNLPAAGVEICARGFLRVDAHLQTTAPHIFGAGDITGHIMLASEGMREGFVAATNAVQGLSATVTDHLVPAGSFTEPEYASVGLTEPKARESHEILTATSQYQNITRAIIDGRTTGFCKLIVDRTTSEVLGCHIVGERAVDIVQVASIALEAGMRRVDVLARAGVAFPTYAEILVRTAVKAAQELALNTGWRGHPGT